jgi:hypothetical protein
MAIVHVQGGSAGIVTAAGLTQAVTLGATVGVGNLVCGVLSYYTPSGPLSSVIDDKGNNYTIVDNIAGTGMSSFTLSTFYLANITNAPQTITATFTNTLFYVMILADEYSGVAAVPLDGHAINQQPSFGNATADAVTSGSITPTVSGDLIYGGVTDGGVSTIVAGTGFTLRQTSTVTSSDFAYSEDLIQGASAAVAATFTLNAGDDFAAGVMAFKAAPPILPWSRWPQLAPILAQ